jgi:hypothetical protein
VIVSLLVSEVRPFFDLDKGVHGMAGALHLGEEAMGPEGGAGTGLQPKLQVDVLDAAALEQAEAQVHGAGNPRPALHLDACPDARLPCLRRPSSDGARRRG